MQTSEASASVNNILLDLHNSSHHTQSNSIIVLFQYCFSLLVAFQTKNQN